MLPKNDFSNEIKAGKAIETFFQVLPMLIILHANMDLSNSSSLRLSITGITLKYIQLGQIFAELFFA